jgi:hypothetical protein
MTQFIVTDPDGWVLHGTGRPDPIDFTGPPSPKPEGADGESFIAWQGVLSLSGAPSPTSKLRVVDGAPVWVERASVADLTDAAIVEIDRQADAARLTVSPPGRDLEYSRAEAQARPYAAAGYPDNAPSCVASWAAAKRWTNGGTPWTAQQAADNIIDTANAWYAALDRIRDLRLDAKEHARAIAADPDGVGAQVAAVLDQFQQDLAKLMKGLING